MKQSSSLRALMCFLRRPRVVLVICLAFTGLFLGESAMAWVLPTDQMEIVEAGESETEKDAEEENENKKEQRVLKPLMTETFFSIRFLVASFFFETTIQSTLREIETPPPEA